MVRIMFPNPNPNPANPNPNPNPNQRFLGAVAEASRLAAPPRLGDKAARFMHLWVCGAGLPGYLGDAVRKFVFESGPVSRQRWLTAERRYRRS